MADFDCSEWHPDCDLRDMETYLSFIPQAWSTSQVQTIPTLGTPLTRIIPAMNIVSAGVLSWFQLQAGSSGSIIPNDASTTNNVSWHQVL